MVGKDGRRARCSRECRDQAEADDSRAAPTSSAASQRCPDEDRPSAEAPKPDVRTPSVRRKFRTLTFGRRGGKVKAKPSPKEGGGKKQRSAKFSFKFSYRLSRAGDAAAEPGTCVCTGYRRTEEHPLGAGVVFRASADEVRTAEAEAALRFNPDDYPDDDWEEQARAQRARELEEGVDPPPGYRGGPATARAHSPRLYEPRPQQLLSTETHLISQFARVTPAGGCVRRTVHTQVDYIHCLVPDLREITGCGFYWGKMDRYEAERLLEARAEGTFLLRDSAQEEYLFSVSFRRYGRSLHARVEQWNHRFSFDSHDPGVFASGTVCGLIEHYKDPSCCMFFEPMLTIPLHRTQPFALQHLCRAAICERTTYDGVNALRLPKTTKAYLKEYHYKQRVRVRRFETEQ